MALPQNRPFNELVVGNQLADISADSSTYVVAPAKGYLVRAFSVLHGAITGADATWTIKVDGTAITGTVTVANASSAAGDVDSITYTTPVPVNEGSVIEFDSSGASSTTAIASFFAVIRT
jgi:hypothetical protein